MLELFPQCGTFKGDAVICIFGNDACTLAKISFERSESLGNFRSEYEYDYEYEFSVLSTRTLKNVDLET